jgi:hypothetical protein
MTLRLTLFLILFCSALTGAEIDLKGKLPEQFDWNGYFEDGDQSTAGQMELAQSAAALVKARIDQICTQYRALMTKRGEAEAVKLFDQMQQHWEKAAHAEVSLVGSAWDPDFSGAKEVYPKHRFKVYLRRLKELVELKGDCMHLNE